MKPEFNIPKELIQYLEKIVQINPSDLKLKDYERGYKAGQLELVAKLKTMYDIQERR
jgi:hypothetical protein